MSYAEFAMTVPPLVQALLSVVLTVGISVVLVWACHRQLLVLSEEPKHNEDDPTPKPPAAYYLSGRIIQVTSLGFVFLFTFTSSSFFGFSLALPKRGISEAGLSVRPLHLVTALPSAAPPALLAPPVQRRAQLQP